MLRTADTLRFAKGWVIAAIAVMAHWAILSAFIQASPTQASDGPGVYAADRVALGTLPRSVAVAVNPERTSHKPDAWLGKKPPAANAPSFAMRHPTAIPLWPATVVPAQTKSAWRAFEARGPPT